MRIILKMASVKMASILGVGLIILFGVPVFGQSSESNSSSHGSGRSSRSSRSSSHGGTGGTVNDRERQREGRTKDRESNSRSSRRSATRGNAKKDDKTKKKDEKKDTKTVKGTEKKSSGGKGKSGGGAPKLDIKFEMQVDPETNIMYLESVGDHPSLNVNVLEKKKFVTRLALYNPKSSKFSQLDVSLKFDPQLMRPVGVDEGSIRSQITKPARVLVDLRHGLLSMSADFIEPHDDSFMTLSKIQWEALEPVANTKISFLNTADHPTGIFDSSGENILHMRSDGLVKVSSNAGLLDATVSIEPTNGSIELADESGNPFSTVALATNISAGTAEGGISLSLRPRKSNISVGDSFLVDVLYSNPKRADIDSVKLQIRFDPETLQVSDTDEGNWITRDTNIYDGAYHEDLPFDYHRKNAVYNTTGLILYDMGFGSRVSVPADGVIATIRFTAQEPVVSTTIAFSPQGRAEDESNTAISFLGFNLIGKPGRRSQYVSNTSVSIAPAQTTAFQPRSF